MSLTIGFKTLIAVAPDSQQIYHFMNAVADVSINMLDGVFFKNDPYQTVRDRSFKKDVNLLIGFTSYEGTLVDDEYKDKYNENNFGSAYRPSLRFLRE